MNNDVQLGVRVPQELSEAIDAEVERQRTKRPGAKVSRGDVVREILYKALIRR